MCADIKFDKMGKMYLLDTQGSVYGPDSRTNLLLTGVGDFEVTVGGNIYAISNSTVTSTNAWIDGVWDTSNNVNYKTFSNTAV